MSNDTVAALRLANTNLHARFARLQRSPPEPEDLSSLLAELLCASGCLRRIPADSVPGPELEKAISEYRSTVEQLAQVLPRVHGRLLTEKARLEIARARVAATTAWAQASANTL